MWAQHGLLDETNINVVILQALLQLGDLRCNSVRVPLQDTEGRLRSSIGLLSYFFPLWILGGVFSVHWVQAAVAGPGAVCLDERVQCVSWYLRASLVVMVGAFVAYDRCGTFPDGLTFVLRPCTL